MSASKKKAQRREAVNPELLTEEQIKQAEYKKKARLYTIIGIVVVVLVAALLIWNSGIFQKNATAATIGGEKVSVAEMSYYYNNNYTRYMYSYYGIGDDDVYDATTGKTYGDYFLELALSDAQLIYAIYNEALANGHSVADVKDEVNAEVESLKSTATAYGYDYKTFLKYYYGSYMTPSIMKDIIARNLVASYYPQEVEADKYDSYTSADFDAYYAENADEVDTFTYSYLYFKADTVETTDADGNELSEDEIAALKEAAMAAAKAKADATLDSYDMGVSLADLISAGEPTTSGDHTTAVGFSAISTVYSEELLELGIDEATVVEYEGYGYYVVINHGRERNETLIANVRHILFSVDTESDSSGYPIAPSEEDMAAAKADAEAALAEFQSGAQTAEAFAALAEKYSDDTGSNTNGGLYEGVAEGDFVTEFNDWMFGDEQPAVGDTAVIRHDGSTTSTSSYWGYHVTYLDSWGEATWQQNVRETLTSEFITEWQDSLCETTPAELGSGAKYVIG